MCFCVFSIVLYVFAQTVFSIMLYDPPSNDTEKFRSLVKEAKNIVVITGAGISDVPSYSEAWGMWRAYEGAELDSMYTMENVPFLVWEFTHYRREVILKKGPNAAHRALADYEEYLLAEGKGRNLTIITQNIDGLHRLAGSRNVIDMSGSLFHTRCLKCGDVRENTQQPLWPSLAGTGDPHPITDYVQADEEDIPHCSKPGCGGRLRPHIVFQGEDLHKDAINNAEDALRVADLCLVVGTSSSLRPVSEFGPTLAGRGVPTAELNLQYTDATMYFPFHFKGNCTKTLPHLLTP